MSKKLAEIEASDATPGPLNVHRLSKTAIVISNPIGMTDADLIFFANARADRDALFHEVRRLQAVVEKYANRENWVRSVNTNGVFMDLWLYDEHGYTRAEECLREDGE